jgi:sugar lactone lactonase YvrE
MRTLSTFAAMAVCVSGWADETSPVITANAVVETVASGYTFTEGPALAPDGSIFFSDIPNRSIHRFDPATGETTVFTDNSRGTNGMVFHRRWLITCEDHGRAVSLRPVDEQHTTFDPSQVLAESFEGNRFNGPNDVLFAEQMGLIYFTDPAYRKKDIEQDAEGVYVILPGLDEQGKSGPSVVRLIDDLVRPNGIGLSPDEQTLYVADNGDAKLLAFDVLSPEQVGNKRVIVDLSDLGKPDGMTVDAHGRLYVAIFDQGVLVLSAAGDRLGFIATGAKTTNCTFGADGKTLYITADKGLQRVVLNTDSRQGLGTDDQ